MKVGDLVRWKLFGDLGIILSLEKGDWRGFHDVYLFYDRLVCSIIASELERVNEEEGQTQEKTKSDI